MSARLSAFLTALTRPVDGLWLVLYRIGLGALLLRQIWKDYSGDLIHTYYVEPRHHFTWPGFDFVQPWPGSGMYLHFALMAVAASCVMLGFRYRAAAVVLWLGYTWLFLIDQCWYLNHYYLICLLCFLAMFLPASHRWSLDAWLRPEIRRPAVPIWTLWLMQFQLAVPYIYGGIAKINFDWMAGEPIRYWLSEQTDFPLLGPFFTEEWCVQIFVWGGLLLDLLIVPALLWRRTRIPALILAVSFHLMNSQLFRIGIFPWLMIWMTLLLFVPPETIARLGRPRNVSPPEPADAVTVRWYHPLLLIGAGTYLLVQLLLPLRHHFYPGHTAFTREGHQFSWRMKLNSRDVDARFFHTDSRTGHVQPLPLSRWISLEQDRKLLGTDQFLQLARWMEQDLIAAGDPDPMVSAEILVGLNGRPLTPLVDPALDLTEVPRGWQPADWITQQPEPRYLSPPSPSTIEDTP